MVFDARKLTVAHVLQHAAAAARFAREHAAASHEAPGRFAEAACRGSIAEACGWSLLDCVHARARRSRDPTTLLGAACAVEHLDGVAGPGEPKTSTAKREDCMLRALASTDVSGFMRSTGGEGVAPGSRSASAAHWPIRRMMIRRRAIMGAEPATAAVPRALERVVDADSADGLCPTELAEPDYIRVLERFPAAPQATSSYWHACEEHAERALTATAQAIDAAGITLEEFLAAYQPAGLDDQSLNNLARLFADLCLDPITALCTVYPNAAAAAEQSSGVRYGAASYTSVIIRAAEQFTAGLAQGVSPCVLTCAVLTEPFSDVFVGQVLSEHLQPGFAGSLFNSMREKVQYGGGRDLSAQSSAQRCVQFIQHAQLKIRQAPGDLTGRTDAETVAMLQAFHAGTHEHGFSLDDTSRPRLAEPSHSAQCLALAARGGPGQRFSSAVQLHEPGFVGTTAPSAAGNMELHPRARASARAVAGAMTEVEICAQMLSQAVAEAIAHEIVSAAAPERPALAARALASSYGIAPQPTVASRQHIAGKLTECARTRRHAHTADRYAAVARELLDGAGSLSTIHAVDLALRESLDAVATSEFDHSAFSPAGNKSVGCSTSTPGGAACSPLERMASLASATADCVAWVMPDTWFDRITRPGARPVGVHGHVNCRCYTRDLIKAYGCSSVELADDSAPNGETRTYVWLATVLATVSQGMSAYDGSLLQYLASRRFSVAFRYLCTQFGDDSAKALVTAASAARAARLEPAISSWCTKFERACGHAALTAAVFSHALFCLAINMKKSSVGDGRRFTINYHVVSDTGVVTKVSGAGGADVLTAINRRGTGALQTACIVNLVGAVAAGRDHAVAAAAEASRFVHDVIPKHRASGGLQVNRSVWTGRCYRMDPQFDFLRSMLDDVIGDDSVGPDGLELVPPAARRAARAGYLMLPQAPPVITASGVERARTHDVGFDRAGDDGVVGRLQTAFAENTRTECFIEWLSRGHHRGRLYAYDSARHAAVVDLRAALAAGQPGATVETVQESTGVRLHPAPDAHRGAPTIIRVAAPTRPRLTTGRQQRPEYDKVSVSGATVVIGGARYVASIAPPACEVVRVDAPNYVSPTGVVDRLRAQSALALKCAGSLVSVELIASDAVLVSPETDPARADLAGYVSGGVLTAWRGPRYASKPHATAAERASATREAAGVCSVFEPVIAVYERPLAKPPGAAPKCTAAGGRSRTAIDAAHAFAFGVPTAAGHLDASTARHPSRVAIRGVVTSRGLMIADMRVELTRDRPSIEVPATEVETASTDASSNAEHVASGVLPLLAAEVSTEVHCVVSSTVLSAAWGCPIPRCLAAAAAAAARCAAASCSVTLASGTVWYCDNTRCGRRSRVDPVADLRGAGEVADDDAMSEARAHRAAREAPLLRAGAWDASSSRVRFQIYGPGSNPEPERLASVATALALVAAVKGP